MEPRGIQGLTYKLTEPTNIQDFEKTFGQATEKQGNRDKLRRTMYCNRNMTGN